MKDASIDNLKLRTALKHLSSLLEEVWLFNQQEGRFVSVQKMLEESLQDYSRTMNLVSMAKNYLSELHEKSDDELFTQSTKLFQNHFVPIYSQFRDAFMKIAEGAKEFLSMHHHFSQNSPEGYIARNHHLMFKVYKELRHELNSRQIMAYKKANELIVDENSLLFDTAGMKHYTFPSDISRMRDFAMEVLENLPQRYQALSFLLEYNVSELIKNAIRHGNNCDLSKQIFVHSEITSQYFRVIVTQQGRGFINLEDWNSYYRQRLQAFEICDVDKMIELACYASENSNEQDGGNALIAALDFWDSGLVFNHNRKSVSALKILPPLSKDSGLSTQLT